MNPVFLRRTPAAAPVANSNPSLHLLPSRAVAAGPPRAEAAAFPAPPAKRIARAAATALTRWHLLSLDAPTVATLWTWFVARCAGVALPGATLAAMFVAVWMLYATDRLLDARLLDARSLDSRLVEEQRAGRDQALPAEALEERHLFHHRHRRGFLAGILAACVVLAALLRELSAAALRLDCLLAALLFGYFFLIHIWPSGARSGSQTEDAARLPKELAVGVFFPAAIFIPTVARVPALRPEMLPFALAFAAVCTLNCLYIYAWEHQPAAGLHLARVAHGVFVNTLPELARGTAYSTAHGGAPGTAHWTTRWATRHLRALTVAVAAVSVLLAVSSRWLRAPSSFAGVRTAPLGLACALSAVLLLALDFAQPRMERTPLRAAADLALLTPLLLLPLIA